MPKATASFRIALGTIALLLTNGCDRISKEDASNNAELWGGYSAQAVYALKEHVFLLKLDDDWKGQRYALSPEGRFKHPSRFYSVPFFSIEKYKRERGQMSPQEIVSGRSYDVPTTVIGIVEVGARIKCTKVIKYYVNTLFFGEAHGTMIFGEILDGKYAGTLVDLSDLSAGKKITYRNAPVTVYAPIPQLLTKREQ